MPIDAAMARLAAEGDAGFAAPVQPEQVPALGSRGGASSALPAPDGQPGTARRAASEGAR